MLAASDRGCGVDSETSIMEYLDFDSLIPHPAATGWLHVIPATLSQRHSFVRKALCSIPSRACLRASVLSKNLCSRFSGRHGSATERLSDGATGPTGLCALRTHHTRLIKTGDYQARSFTALEAAM